MVIQFYFKTVALQLAEIVLQHFSIIDFSVDKFVAVVQ